MSLEIYCGKWVGTENIGIISKTRLRIIMKRNDERGTRTPGMQGITGLAIPRHTGLGYLVTKDFKKRVPLNAFYVFNLFQGKGFTETILQEV